jgi:hypothetical protein
MGSWGARRQRRCWESLAARSAREAQKAMVSKMGNGQPYILGSSHRSLFVVQHFNFRSLSNFKYVVKLNCRVIFNLESAAHTTVEYNITDTETNFCKLGKEDNCELDRWRDRVSTQTSRPSLSSRPSPASSCPIASGLTLLHQRSFSACAAPTAPLAIHS